MSKALNNITYGLYAITTNFYGSDNVCIVNTVQMVTETPTRICVAINKNNYTHSIIEDTKEFNVSVLTTKTPFKIFKKFGMQSGRDVNKFDGCDFTKRQDNGILTLTQYTNSIICAKVVSTVDLGSHTLFIADVTCSETISDEESATYAYYHSNIKNAPATNTAKGYVCTICGYVHEGSELPEDFVCPLCNHGAKFFEKLT
jgi:flavin reductase (DIM6/NTAB) family NADH-FMN oxidoreductase RutF